MYKIIRILFVVFLSINLFQSSAQSSTNALRVGLNDLFLLADKNNLKLKVLDTKEKIAGISVQEEQQELLPNVDASFLETFNGDGWIADRSFSNGFGTPIPKLGNNFVLEARQVIYAGKAINTSIEMAKRNFTLARLEKEKSRQDLRFMITGYYLEILKLRNQKQILEKNIDLTNKLIEQIKAKQQQGTALKNNVTRYELQLQTLNLSLYRLKNSIIIINNDLVKELQFPEGTSLDLKDENNFSTFIEGQSTDKSFWENLAEGNSPLLKLTITQIERAKDKEKLIKAEKYPEIFAFAADNLTGPIMIEIPVINKNFNYWYTGIGIRYNISSLYKNGVKAKQSKLATQNAVESRDIIKDQLNTEIRAAGIHYSEALSIYQTQLKSLELATQNYIIVKDRYLNSLALITEMLDAENAKLDAEMSAANAQINILFYYYQLKKLAGTL